MRAALLAKGHSARSIALILRAHRFSTSRQYQSVWEKFLFFLSDNGQSHGDISLPVVCDFLALQCVGEHRDYRTIAAYKSALRHPLLFACDLDINSEESALFMRGVFQFRPPQRAAPMPSWSLNSVLSFLRSATFEPLESVDALRLSQKTLFLILLASGRRIGDIANLSRHSCPRSGSLSLSWVPGYRPKVLTPRFRGPPPSISSLDSVLPDDLLLCPVRAYRIYVERSAEWLDDVPLLFRKHSSLWSRPDSGEPVSIGIVSSWLRSLVKDSVLQSGLPVPSSIGPHQVRKLAASYAKQAGQEECLVRKVMGFSSVSILRKNYVAEVPPLLVSCVLPGGPFLPPVS